MNGAVIPALVAAGGGTAMMAGVHLHERRRDEAMRASRVRLSVRFPTGLEPLRAYAALDSLAGLPLACEVVSEIVAREGSIGYGLWVPAAVRPSVEASLRGLIPSIRLTEEPLPASGRATLALRLFIPSPTLLQAEGAEAASRALLSGLAALGDYEQVIVRWALRAGGPRRRPQREPQTQTEKDVARAWQRKTALAGMRASGLVLVHAVSMTRARVLASHVENVLRARRGLTGAIRVTRERGNRSLASLPRTNGTSGWLSTPELVGVVAWPLGPDVLLGVEIGAARELLVPRHVPREGRRLFVGRDAEGERPVALEPEGARHHMAVVGPSGVGKSVLLARSILSDIEHGFGGVLIDPKRDLVETVLRRVKPADAERIVVLDPGDARPVPGLAVLSGGDPDLRADVLTGTLKAIFGDAWGVRSDFYGRLAIRTLSELPGATLADLGRLFYEDEFRRRAIARLSDPFLLSSWQSYEALSPAARAEHVQAPMARVMALLSRPRVRSVLASPEAKLDISRLLTERKWLIASLAPGQLGEAGAAIVGASLVYAVWSAVEARVAVAPERRHPIFLYADELATLTTSLPFGFEQLAERARGLGAGLSVAIQTLGRIPEPTRSAVLGNVATFVTFRAPAEEAARLSRQLPGLTEADLMALARFEVAARIGTGVGSTISVVTGRTEPLPAETGMAEAIRDASAARYAPRERSATRPAEQLPETDSGLPPGIERRQA